MSETPTEAAINEFTAKGYEERELDLSQMAPNDVIEIVLRRK